MCEFTFERINATASGKSIIDITMVSNGIKEQIKEWKVQVGKIGNSDHNPITFVIDKQGFDEKTRHTTRRYVVDPEKWNEFDDALACEIDKRNDIIGQLEEDEIGQEGIDKAANAICIAMQRASRMTFGANRGNRREREWDKPFTWNEKIAELNRIVRRTKNRIRRAVKNNPGYVVRASLIEQAKEEQKQLTAAINEERGRSFEELVGSVDERDAWDLVKEVVKKKKMDPAVGATLKVNGDYTKNEKHTAEAILEHFYPKDDGSWKTRRLVEQQSERQKDNQRAEHEEDEDENGNNLTYDEIVEAAGKINPKKSTWRRWTDV